MRINRFAILALFGAVACAASGPAQSKEDMAEDRSVAAERQLASAADALAAEDAGKAQTCLASAKKLLDDPSTKRHPDYRFMREELDEKTAQLAELKKVLEQRAFEAARDDHLEKLKAATAALGEALDVLKREAGAVEEAAVEDAEVNRKTIATLVADGMRFKDTASDYDRGAKRAKKAHDKAATPIVRARDVRAFRDGPIKARTDAERLLESAGVEDDPAKQVDLYVEAKLSFTKCVRDGRALSKSRAHLRRVKFDVGRGRLVPKKVVDLCKRRERATGRLLAKLAKKQKRKKKKKKKKKKS